LPVFNIEHLGSFKNLIELKLPPKQPEVLLNSVSSPLFEEIFERLIVKFVILMHPFTIMVDEESYVRVEFEIVKLLSMRISVDKRFRELSLILVLPWKNNDELLKII